MNTARLREPNGPESETLSAERLTAIRDDTSNGMAVRIMAGELLIARSRLEALAARNVPEGWVDAAPVADRWPQMGDTMRFLGENGYDHELKQARETFIVDCLYEVIDCEVGDWSHSIRFKGIDGRWNGVMFQHVEQAAVPPGADNAQVAPVWRCFHCDETFTDEHCARLHFGNDEGRTPACQIKGSEGSLVEALRRAENDAADAWHAIHNETTDAAKAYFAQNARHQEQLRAVEQIGYDRGIADAKAHPETIGLCAPTAQVAPAEPAEGEVAGWFWRWASSDEWRPLSASGSAAGRADFVRDQEKIAPVVIAQLYLRGSPDREAATREAVIEDDASTLDRLRRGTAFDLERVREALLEKLGEIEEANQRTGDQTMEIAALVGEAGGLAGMIYPLDMPSALRALAQQAKPQP